MKTDEVTCNKCGSYLMFDNDRCPVCEQEKIIEEQVLAGFIQATIKVTRLLHASEQDALNELINKLKERIK